MANRLRTAFTALSLIAFQTLSGGSANAAPSTDSCASLVAGLDDAHKINKVDTTALSAGPNPFSVRINQNATLLVQSKDADNALQVALSDAQFATLSQSTVSGTQPVNITVHGTSLGRTCLTITTKSGKVLAIPLSVNEEDLPRFQITTAFASSRVPNRTFNSIPSPMPNMLTFRDLLNENSDQRNGAAIIAHTRLTESPGVNVYASLGAFTGSSGGYVAGISIGYKNAIFVTVGSHFTSSIELNPRYALDSAVPAGIQTVPTVTVQRVAPTYAIGITLSSISDILSGKNPTSAH